MMRKLAVTVFALSLVALGCGSDEGTPPKNDAGAQDGPKVDATMGPDTQVQNPDAPLGPDTTLGPDSSIADVAVAVEAGKTDEPTLAAEVQTAIEAGRNPETREVGRPEVGLESGQPDTTAVRLETQGAEPAATDGGPDVQATEAAPALDGGVEIDAESNG